MTKTIFILLLCISLSCYQQPSKIKTEKLKPELSIDSNVKNENLLSFFNYFKHDTIKIEVEDYLHNKSLKPEECLPLSFTNLFEGFITQNQPESTGAKPIGKVKINEQKYFLVIVQQDDYGPIYYGITYNLNKNKIIEIEKVAETWGDAGDSQTCYSILIKGENEITIHKIIETCHADLIPENNKMKATNIECTDSTSIIEMSVSK